jgi:S1-C subfamily serine protease
LKSVLACCVVLSAAPVFGSHPAVVRLSVPVKEGARSLGSGVLAGADERFGYVLTAHHVVRDAEGHPKVRFANGTVENGHVLKTDAAADLALIRINRPPVRPVEWAAASPTKGDQLVAAGFGSDGKYQEAAGPVIGFTTRAEETPDWMIVKAQVRSGDSGGPVFTQDGKLAGVLWGCNENTYASPVGRLYKFAQSKRGRLFPIGRGLLRLRRAEATAAAPSKAPHTPGGA